MYQNNNMYGGFYQGGMPQYAQTPVAKMTQVLTPEQIKALRTTSSAFSLQVDPLDITRSMCTHKDQGKIALVENNDGTVTCTVCGARFKLLDMDVNQAAEITAMFVDILQSIKTYYLDIPENYVTEYFKMIPLLEKVPKFYELALHNFRKYEQVNPLQQGGSMFGFNMLNALTTPGFAGGMMYGQQPAMQPGMGYPQPGMQPGYPQPGMQPMYPQPGYPQPVMGGSQPGYNAFGGYGGAPVGQPGVDPTAAVQQNQGQQAQGGNQNQVQTTKVFNV